MTAVLYYSMFAFCAFMARVSVKVKIKLYGFFKRNSKARREVLISLIISSPIVLLMGVRYGIGTDYFNFQHQIERFFLNSWKLDVGFAYLIKAVYYLKDDYKFFVFVTSLIIGLLFTLWVVVYCENDFRAISIYCILCIYFGVWCNNTQQSVAMAVTILSIKYIYNKNPIAFFSLVGVAGLLHESAFVFAVSYFFLPKKEGENYKTIKRTGRVVVLMIAAYIAYLLYYYRGVSSELIYSKYITSLTSKGRTYKYLLAMGPLYIIECSFFHRILRKDKNSILAYVFIALEMIANIATIKIAFAYRLGFFFSIGHILLMNEILKDISVRHPKMISILKFMYFALVSLSFGFINIYSGHNGIVPYRMIGG